MAATQAQLSRGGAQRFEEAATASRGPNPDSVTLTSDGAIVRYRLEDLGSYKGVEFYAEDTEFEVGRDGEEIQYPYVDGQTEEDTGRAPWRGSIVTRWFGTNWLARLENFIGVIEVRSDPGDLQLPGGFARINAKIKRGKVQKRGGRGGATMTLTFYEVGHNAFVYMYDAATSPATQAQDLVPEGFTDAQDMVDLYADSVRDPDASAEDQLYALNDAQQELNDAEAEVDGDTPEGQEQLDRLALCRSRMREAYPDQEYLEQSGI